MWEVEYFVKGCVLMKGSARIPTPAEQSKAGKSGGKKKLDANAIEALWDEVQAHRAATFRWAPMKRGKA
jgi:hypothetical protein